MKEKALSGGPVSLQLDALTEDGTQKVWFRRALPPNAPRARDNPNYGRQVLPKGHVRRQGARPLSCDILFEPDVPVNLRDGTVIYTDVLRPVAEGAYPAIVSWGPFGKSIGGVRLEDFPDRTGVPLDATTELMKWEAADPGYWVEHGYAVLHPDVRGAFRSEGNIYWMGRREAEDGYDFIEWAAAQPWSNGHLGMAGNSWLAIMQWFIAAEQPPHLSAIAPWEGASDLMREFVFRGGIPVIVFPDLLTQALPGEGLIEDIAKMAMTEQDFTGYWKDKRVRFDQIKVPAYVSASYDNFLHTYGTFAAWREMSSKDKWLRIHNTHEWQDLYDPANTDDLRRFFDQYLKAIDNGWEQTPRIRAAILDPSGEDEVGRVIECFPPGDYPHRAFYLSSDNTLTEVPQRDAASICYPVEQVRGAAFKISIGQHSEIIGYCKLKLWVEADGSDDMDLLVLLEKLDAEGGGSSLRHNPYGAPVPLQSTGMLRVSRRELDLDRSTPSEPFLRLIGEQRLKPGEIVPVEIGFWPIGLKIHAGEALKLTIIPYHSQSIPFYLGAAGIDISATSYTFDPKNPPEMVTLSGSTEMVPAWVSEQAVKPVDRNKGTHRIYFGGKYDSHLLVPIKAAAPQGAGHPAMNLQS